VRRGAFRFRARIRKWLAAAAAGVTGAFQIAAAADGVFVRFRMDEPKDAQFHVKLGGFIHEPNWTLPSAIIRPDAGNERATRVPAGQFTPWFDLAAHAGKSLHGRQNRAGGLAEFPNITAQFITDPPAPARTVGIELATTPNDAGIVKRWNEHFEGDTTSFLVSPNLRADAGELELGSEMTARRARWAIDATGGTRHAPKQLLLQTSFWSPQRTELNLREAQILSLLGFNIVGNMPAGVAGRFPEFKAPSASHDVLLGPESSREQIRASWDKLARNLPRDDATNSGAPFNFQDEICARPPIGTGAVALQHFHAWLASQKIAPAKLGVATLEEAIPIESPEKLREAMQGNAGAARRLFYYTSRFRQHALTERLRWNTEELHARAPQIVSSTLLADHPFFSGTGLGMGMQEQNNTWGGWPLAADWFEIGRTHAVDMPAIEDWMGLQFMYGPSFTWEGFQLMGFQSAIFRSASTSDRTGSTAPASIPLMAWITPSDERNLRLKTTSALCQGTKNFYYWTYGPTATSTENYWSDQPGSYPGMAHLSNLLEFGEQIIAPGTTRRTRVALLYSISSDLWQPFGYAHMLERRGLYFALIHEQYLVDLLTEEDVAAGRLDPYRILYAADPCISAEAARTISAWVDRGGTIVATCAAGSQNEFGESSEAMSELFGLDGEVHADCQRADYRTRGRLNDIEPRDRVKIRGDEFGIVGVKADIKLRDAKTVLARFDSDGAPALVSHRFGQGRAVYFAFTPGIGYLKDAHFVATALAEKWPAKNRHVLTEFAPEARAAPLVKLSEPVIEAGVYDADETGTALILANFTYRAIGALEVEVPTRKPIRTVKSLAHGSLRFETVEVASPWREEGYPFVHRFHLPLGDDDIVLLQQ
jgi:hypothetical protein